MTDDELDGSLDENDEATRAHVIDNVPGYLFLRDGAMQSEARRAYALQCLINNEGLIHPNFVPTWHLIVQFLEKGEMPKLAELKALKTKKQESE